MLSFCYEILERKKGKKKKKKQFAFSALLNIGQLDGVRQLSWL
jgi:hypothetical protein